MEQKIFKVMTMTTYHMDKTIGKICFIQKDGLFSNIKNIEQVADDDDICDIFWAQH